MNVASIETARERREKAARAASQLTKISERCNVKPGRISKEQLVELPEWCSLDIEQMRALQKTCGALYLSPAISASIDGRMLRDFRDLVGNDSFNFIRNTQQYTHEVSTRLYSDKLAVSVMAAGSGVMLGTLKDQKLRAMFEHLLGPGSDWVEAELADSIVRDADFLLIDKPAATAEQ